MEEERDTGYNEEQFEEEEFEPSHTDKLVGVFSEPAPTFETMSKFPAKATDWVLPLLLMIVIAIASNVIMMNNPIIQQEMVEKRQEAVKEMVEKGELTQEQADQQMERVRQFMGSSASTIIQGISIAIFSFITLLIVAGVFHLISKFGLKGEGTYSGSLVAYGLPYYIVVVQLIVMVIIALLTDKFMMGTSVTDFVGITRDSFAGFILSKADPFSIWFYAVVSIGLAKMHKSETMGKYFGIVFGLWLGFAVVMYFLSQAVPALRWLAG
jgi:hypothetical protein